MNLAALPSTHDESGIQPIAEGGMASVHLVAGGADGRLFALKRLHPHLAKDEYFASMLVDEARIASSIRHENVVTTYGLGMYGDRPCVVMEYVPGLSVSDVICYAHPARVPVAFALKIAAHALRGLHAAHETCDAEGRPLEIVHRDVSPQNILVGTDGITRVLDFGIAKAAHRVHSTRPGDVKGKLAYMAPEQLMGDRVDRRTDLRAVGVVLWEMLTGAPLFHAKREEDSVAKIVQGRVRRPSELASGVSPEIDAVVLRALALRPDDRFASALEMAEALEAIMVDYWASAAQIGDWVATIGELEPRGEDLVRTSTLPPTVARPVVEATTLVRPTLERIPEVAPAPPRSWFASMREPAILFFSALLVGLGGGFYLCMSFAQ